MNLRSEMALNLSVRGSAPQETVGNSSSSRQPVPQQNSQIEHVPESINGRYGSTSASSKKDQIEKFLKAHWDVKQMVEDVEKEQRKITDMYTRSCERREKQNQKAMEYLDEIVNTLDRRKRDIKMKEQVITEMEHHKGTRKKGREDVAKELHTSEQGKEKVLANLGRSLQRLAPKPRKKEPLPSYISYPEVEVATKIFYISNVDTADLKFEIDLLLMIDWVDENFRDMKEKELHYLDWEETYFNPCVILENSVAADDSFGEGRDDIPRFDKVDHATGRPVPDEKDRIWLKKTQRWRGYMAMEDVDLSCFPFDMQVLPIVIKALPLRLNAGRSRQPRLTHPTKRLFDGEYRRTVERADEYALKHTGGGQFIGPMVEEQLTEFHLKGVRGLTDAECMRQKNKLQAKVASGECYQVQVFVARPLFSSYCWDLIIMTFLVLLSATSFWDTASPDISSRLSISLTIILTLAAYTSNRPAPISKTPTFTFQDDYEIWCLYLVILVSIMNIISVVTCGGDHQNSPEFMQKQFEENEQLCSLSMYCGSREIDCGFLFLFLCFMLLVGFWKVTGVIKRRYESTHEIREMTTALVAEEKKLAWSKLSKHVLSGIENLQAQVDRGVGKIREEAAKISEHAEAGAVHARDSIALGVEIALHGRTQSDPELSGQRNTRRCIIL